MGTRRDLVLSTTYDVKYERHHQTLYTVGCLLLRQFLSNLSTLYTLNFNNYNAYEQDL
jgi:hypothetical protein